LQSAKAICDSNKNALDFTLTACKRDLNVSFSDANLFFSDFNVSDFNAAKIKINFLHADYNACATDKNALLQRLRWIDSNISARFATADENATSLKNLLLDINAILPR
jgi:hypothetical protein